ncbi:endo-1,3(4)-beta-glucanase [Hortaea werneckii]|nr:endo-1,3(4)-beta-glucanase [Hortaea werneckii]
MYFSTLLTQLALMSTTGWAQYTLQDDYFANGDFFSKFEFFTGEDPTHGFVAYQDKSSSEQSKLISSSSNEAQMKVDTENQTPNGRPSVRITSNNKYNSGLIIMDASHMPTGCGTWPAFWMVGPDWPAGGEIDIIEGVHEQSANDMTLHTSDGCTVGSTGFTGNQLTDNCYVNAPDQGNNVGCQIAASDSNTYGAGFNSNGGGVYATEWTDSAIDIWFFPHGSVPSDIQDNSPKPSGWGKPLAHFQGDCDIPGHFHDLQIVFDTTFCGDWAGNTWGSSSCSSKANTCNDFVQNNPQAFEEAYWSINALKVYQANGESAETAAPTATPTSTMASESIPTPSATSFTYAVSSAAPSSPPEVTTSSPPPGETSSAAAEPTESWGDNGWGDKGWGDQGWGDHSSRGWDRHSHWIREPSAAAAVKRHMRHHHKRHGAGRL